MGMILIVCMTDMLMSCNFFLLKDGVSTFNDILQAGLVEYLDIDEENNSWVCQCFSF